MKWGFVQTLFLQALPSAQVPWWLDRVAVPILFTFFGACLGFASGRLKDWLDDRKTKTAFLKAIRIELLAISGHLEGTLKDTTEHKERLEKGERTVIHLATFFLTTVYTSQLGKLRDPSDPRIFEIVRFYGNLSNVETIKSHLTSFSFDVAKLTKEETDREGPIVGLYSSSLNEVIKRIEALLPAARILLAKLPE